MTRVDFYILPDADEARRQTYVCRVVDKAFRLGHRVWIHVPDPERARALDERLWTFRQDSFLPHERVTDGPADADCPVLLAASDEPDDTRELLVNEHAEVPAFFSRFARVAEFINHDPDVRRLGRERYAFYRDRGYELHYHKVD